MRLWIANCELRMTNCIDDDTIVVANILSMPIVDLVTRAEQQSKQIYNKTTKPNRRSYSESNRSMSQVRMLAPNISNPLQSILCVFVRNSRDSMYALISKFIDLTPICTLCACIEIWMQTRLNLSRNTSISLQLCGKLLNTINQICVQGIWVVIPFQQSFTPVICPICSCKRMHCSRATSRCEPRASCCFNALVAICIHLLFRI